MGNVLQGLDADLNATLNDAWSRSPAQIDLGVHVRGTLHAANQQIAFGASVQASDRNPTFDPANSLSWSVTYPSTASQDVILLAGQSATVHPGVFGTLSAGGGATLTMEPGTYYVTNLVFGTGATVKLDQTNGPIGIYANNLLTLNGTVSPVSGTTPDLAIVYLGSLPVLVGGLGGTVYKGALVAPFAPLTLQSILPTNQVHTGFFAGKTVELATSAEAQYAPPLALLKLALPPGNQCRALATALAPSGSISATLARYCPGGGSGGGCGSTTDIDHDGVPDCEDGCPTDPKKITPGICGCGNSDTDTDGDGVPNCIDKCPNDPNNTSPGQCGCAGDPNVAPAGTACTDAACPQSGATCDGNGVCGNRSACSPCAGGKLITMNGTSYWFCEGLPATLSADGGVVDGGSGATPLTWTGAQQACSGKGLTLTRINTLNEDRFITLFLTGPTWLGANDSAVSGTWRWAAPNNVSGDQFWSGGANGSPVNNRFAYWSTGSPGSQACAAISPGAGQWSDVGCNESLGYICEFRTPIISVPLPPPPGNNGQPSFDSRACVPSDAAAALLPDSEAQLIQDRANAEAGIFNGSAANPPAPGTTCPSDKTDAAGIGSTSLPFGGGCSFINKRGEDCKSNADCGHFGAGYVCRQIEDSLSCSPPDSGPPPTGPLDGSTCKGRSWCVQLSCPQDPHPTRCDQIEICDPGTTFDAGLDPGSNLTPQDFNPASLFEGGIPDAAPTAAYSDPVTGGTGTRHPWCFMNPQDTNSVQPAAAAPRNNSGQSGTHSVISFGFDPNLDFTANAKPIALGETNMSLDAHASLDATFNLNNFLGQSFQESILHASAELKSDRCSVNDNNTELSVFGLDNIDLQLLGIPKFDTASEFPDLTSKCNSAIGDFQYAADRAKKAFRDAQQLLGQYYAAKNLGQVLGGGNLCQQIGVISAKVPFFPEGNDCPDNEPTEITINRFIDYYQGPGSGQISRLKEAQSTLTNASTSISQLFSGTATVPAPHYHLDFLNTDQEESQTIVNVPFAIGPVPMVLQIDVFASYGIDGNFAVDLELPSFSIFTDPSDNPPPQTLAQLSANVNPHASAGLSAFVAAGFDLGPIGAAVGIEGDLTLAEISAPIFAGAGLSMGVTTDHRAIPLELQPPVSELDPTNTFNTGFQFGLPKSFKFYVWYNYGVGVDVENVLSGEIDAAVRIDFFFFSRTWRARVVRFNGWSQHFDILSGHSPDPNVVVQPTSVGKTPTEAGTTNMANSTTPMGLSEQQVPLTKLALLTPPPPVDGGVPASDAGAMGFDSGLVQSFFYDNLCCVTSGSCSSPGQAPLPPHCCPGYTCVTPDAGADSGTLNLAGCVLACFNQDEECGSNLNNCCTGLVCNSLRMCEVCIKSGNPCATSDDCCSGLMCDGNNLCSINPM